ncbi:MAG: hypothetical protein CV087_16335 [Candidatus Brocadia sp. WS118]|nr:MAG: hypothetical protein CV087_16335 [Candidatus Brocadia sp. WS118]
MNRFIYCLCLCLLYSGCTRSIDNPHELLNYINDKNNGLVRERRVDDLIFLLRYLPPEYFVYLEKNEENKKDGLLKEYQNGISFSFHIKPAGKFGNILYRGIQNEEQLKSRINFLNFQFGSLLELNCSKTAIPPVLCVLENNYNLNDGLRFLIVFEKNDDAVIADNLDIKFIDLVFDSGIHHFNFNVNDIKNIPIISL